ncbi:cyclin-F2-2-like [Lolium rigidum]|uniref:cyclin-F2-2-like n=1 Tax=Lolium rigidum TaxID=89674 RepID=UPI001F5E12F7|nr:cyclin-F2-2-like [Lolium rigidum]
MDPWAFARPPPPGFGFSCARQPVADLSARHRPPPPGFVISCVRQPLAVDDVPARVRPPPPGFSRPCNKVRPPSPREIPVPPKFSKRAAPPVSTTVSDKPSAKRQRLCYDYEDDIEANLRRTERSPDERPRPDYMKTVQQGRVSPSDRARLVGWMDAFVRHHDLVDGTLHHAVAYVDRVLSVRAMNTHTDYELRLLGAAAVFVAAKYEDGWRTMPKLDPDKIVSYGRFASRKEVLDMERHMVAALGYQLGGPTAHTFVSRFTKHAQGEEDLKKIQRMAHHLADESLRNYACLGYLPSVVASSAILLARFALNPPDVPAWSTEMQELTGYNVMNLVVIPL